MSASLAPECNEVKERYDSCFLKWYSEKYLRGKGTEDECASLFKDYKKCLSTALKDRGIDQMLSEARADHKETDDIHMRRKCKCSLPWTKGLACFADELATRACSAYRMYYNLLS